jgi:hypothetical protein
MIVTDPSRISEKSVTIMDQARAGGAGGRLEGWIVDREHDRPVIVCDQRAADRRSGAPMDSCAR